MGLATSSHQFWNNKKERHAGIKKHSATNWGGFNASLYLTSLALSPYEERKGKTTQAVRPLKERQRKQWGHWMKYNAGSEATEGKTTQEVRPLKEGQRRQWAHWRKYNAGSEATTTQAVRALKERQRRKWGHSPDQLHKRIHELPVHCRP